MILLERLQYLTIVAVNKMDSNADLENMSNFYELGCADILPVSALRRVNINLLLDKIIDLLPEKKQSSEQSRSENSDSRQAEFRQVHFA